MLDELTPEQRFELFAYAAREPFGEERLDMRMARMIQFYYDSHRPKGAKRVTLGEFTLYPDVVERAAEEAGTRSLKEFLGKVAKVG